MRASGMRLSWEGRGKRGGNAKNVRSFLAPFDEDCLHLHFSK